MPQEVQGSEGIEQLKSRATPKFVVDGWRTFRTTSYTVCLSTLLCLDNIQYAKMELTKMIMGTNSHILKQ